MESEHSGNKEGDHGDSERADLRHCKAFALTVVERDDLELA